MDTARMPLKQPEFKTVPLGQIKPWGKNPREISAEQLDTLARSLEKFGEIRNLTCWMENGAYVTGGGNMRYRAMTEVLKWKPERLVQISVNYPSSEAEKIELAFLDNQAFGFYNELAVVDLVRPLQAELDMDFVRVEMEKPVSVENLLTDFDVDEPLPIVDGRREGVEMPKRQPINPEYLVCGFGSYIGVVPRDTGEPITDMLRKKFGEGQEDRKEAFIWVCNLLRQNLVKEVGEPEELVTGWRNIQRKRTAERESMKEAERKEKEARTKK